MLEERPILDNEFLRQFECSFQEQMVVVEYALQEKKIFLTKLILPAQVPGEEWVTALISDLLEVLEERRLRVVPTCSELKMLFKKHKSFQRMLPVGIRL
ncbi:MAG: N-acetyltransferase [Flavobacteriaceae bacterium]|nr:N-acetyltransferase [Flavobacteriaceae bacterium]